MSRCCFHVQIHINYLLNISGGVAAATCFDFIVQLSRKSPRVRRMNHSLKFTSFFFLFFSFFRAVMGRKGTVVLLGPLAPLDHRGLLGYLGR